MWSRQISSKLFTDAEPRTQLNILLNEILVGITQDLGDLYKISFTCFSHPVLISVSPSWALKNEQETPLRGEGSGRHWVNLQAKQDQQGFPTKTCSARAPALGAWVWRFSVSQTTWACVKTQKVLWPLGEHLSEAFPWIPLKQKARLIHAHQNGNALCKSN